MNTPLPIILLGAGVIALAWMYMELRKEYQALEVKYSQAVEGLRALVRRYERSRRESPSANTMIA
jgi:hypothetical protein